MPVLARQSLVSATKAFARKACTQDHTCNITSVLRHMALRMADGEQTLRLVSANPYEGACFL